MATASRLDRIDRRILVALQADARLTNQALSERVALSPSACLARVRRLERTGIIQFLFVGAKQQDRAPIADVMEAVRNLRPANPEPKPRL